MASGNVSGAGVRVAVDLFRGLSGKSVEPVVLWVKGLEFKVDWWESSPSGVGEAFLSW